MLYICTMFCESISKSVRVTDPNSRVDTKVFANADGQTNGQKSGSLYHAMSEAGPTIR